MPSQITLHPVNLQPAAPRDYVSPGLKTIRLDEHFPNMIAGDPNSCPWSHLRRNTGHVWYCDRRVAGVGFLNRDEAHVLYNTALQFAGGEALEIGCFMGWSACHLAAGGVSLDVIDPFLANPEVQKSVTQSLAGAGVLPRVRLYAAASPDAVHALGRQGKRWSLIFIDGDHEFPAPVQDAVACEPYADPDAAILFHDVNAPAVAEGVYYLRDRGWNMRIYHTTQIMAVCWRGAVTPIEHIPDPPIARSVPNHLQAAA
jgi:predicted O-methyltransferase YrrM